jgi:hypothetical protein
VFAIAWKRFLERYRSDLGYDFVFVNNGFDHTFFSSVLSPFPTFRLQVPLSCPFDTHETYWPIYHLGGSYDFVLRVDHDAFPSVEAFASMWDFLIGHPATDVVSASNYPRTVDYASDKIRALDPRFLSHSEKRTWGWVPWGYPTQNSDLLVMSTRFFRQCSDVYRSHPRISRNLRGYVCPFDTSILRWGDICRLLGTRPEPGTSEEMIRIDGSINSDFWAIMCSQKMSMAGIVDVDGRSFQNKNHLSRYGQAMGFPSFGEVRDNDDVAFPHQTNVVAPYFHVGNGYLSEAYFDPPQERTRAAFFTPQFQSRGFGYYVAHFAIVRDLALRSGLSRLVDDLNNRMSSVFAEYGVDVPAMNEFCSRIVAFYSGGMEGYL